MMTHQAWRLETVAPAVTVDARPLAIAQMHIPDPAALRSSACWASGRGTCQIAGDASAARS